MTRNETLILLQRITDGYPAFMKDRDAKRTADIWEKCLEFEDAADLDDAFIRYMRTDTRNVPPTPGSLLQFVDHHASAVGAELYEFPVLI